MSHHEIVIRGAREHNLKNISLSIPRDQLVVFTGVSGSGKSSLAFDTIFAEGQRRYVESLSAYARQFLGNAQKPDVDEIEGLSPAIAIDQKAHSSNPRSTVATVTELYDYLRVLFARVGVPHCVICARPIERLTVDQMVDVVRERMATMTGKKQESLRIFAPLVRGRKGEYYQLLHDVYSEGYSHVRVDGVMSDLTKPLKLGRYKQHSIEVLIDTFPPALFQSEATLPVHTRLAEAIELAVQKGNEAVIVLYPDGSEQLLSSRFSCPDDGFSFPEIEPRLFSFNSPYGACPGCTGLGVKDVFSDEPCEICQGARLRKEALHVWLPQRESGSSVDASTQEKGLSIRDVVAMPIDEATDYFLHLPLSKRDQEIAAGALREIINRLQFLLDVGLQYLTLDRASGTLSGGEAQRIRLASQVGSRLVGAMYVLDEPTIGLHQKDNERLIATLTGLRDLGNTVLVVEHDEDTIRAADYMVEIGPGAGVHGGEVVCAGKVPDIFSHKTSLTAAYLRGDRSIPLPEQRRTSQVALKVRGARENNLKNVDVDIPLRRFVCVTGLSGSGKSTLVQDIVYKSLAKRLNGASEKPGEHTALLGVEYLDRVLLIDQSPIGRTPRSNPATYTGAWAPIREMFASTEDARLRGYKPGRFSFNVPGGRCEACEGHGVVAIEMHFLPTVYVPCDVCRGKRFDRETLEVTYKDKNISEVLDMTVEESEAFFRDLPPVHDVLKTLVEVGLGYVKLGQPAPSLSGGEAQRVKLATELARRARGKALYVFDEPTTGLHFEDVRRLLEVMHRLVDHGHSVLVIEHNLDVIKTADWIIDLGPEGGARGGQIMAQGTPEDIMRSAKSDTGFYLRRMMKKK